MMEYTSHLLYKDAAFPHSYKSQSQKDLSVMICSIIRSAPHIGPHNSNKTGRRMQANALTSDHQYDHYIFSFAFGFEHVTLLSSKSWYAYGRDRFEVIVQVIDLIVVCKHGRSATGKSWVHFALCSKYDSGYTYRCEVNYTDTSILLHDIIWPGSQIGPDGSNKTKRWGI